MRPLILLPPSETKQAGGTGAWDPSSGAFSGLGGHRLELAEALSKAMADRSLAARLIGLTGPRLAGAETANREVVGAPVRPAWQRYQGVVWEHLDPAGLAAPARRRAGRVAIVSGLGGLFAFGDPVPEYKLKMGAALPGLGSVARFWLGPVTEAVAAAAGRGPVWDLLPGEHRRALDRTALARLTVVDFRSAGGAGAAGHAAKAAKGRFVRHLLGTAGDPLAAADSFRWEGWTGRVHDDRLVTVTAPG